MAPDSLAGKVVLLTGPARGIGAETARLLARRGAKLALVDLDREALDRLAVASVAAISAPPGMAPYGASKAGIEALASTLRVEVAQHGVDVGVAYFSWLATVLVTDADDHSAFARMRAGLSGPFGKTYPVIDAAEAIVRGIERRSRRVFAPKWVAWLQRFRGLLGKSADRDTLKVAPEVERLSAEEVARRGREEASLTERARALQDSSGQVTAADRRPDHQR